MCSVSVVLKFGGTSVGTPERIRAVAQIIAQHRQRYPNVAVVVSAMGDTTDELIELAKKVSPLAQHPQHRREMDMLLTSGERISMALLSMALGDIGCPAISLTGSQSGIITDTVHGEARIAEIRPIRILECFSQGKVVIVAGFQGVSREKEITTLGRGGSDTSAVALGVTLKSQEVIIYTDVDGFYTADPRVVKSARRLEAPGWDLAVEVASRGAQVLHPRCIELAWQHGMPVRVCSSFRGSEPLSGGTVIKGVVMNSSIEQPRVFSLALQRNLVFVQKRLANGVLAADLFAELNQLGLRAASWSQNLDELELLVETHQLPILEKRIAPDRKCGQLARISLVGCGLAHAADVQCGLDKIVREAGLKILMNRTTPTAIEIVTDDGAALDDLVRKIHERFVS
jgi:aspartate kinase